MSGISPLTGPLKIRVEREAATVRLEHFATITEFENVISLLQSQLTIAQARNHGLRVTNENLTDVIRSRPVSPKKTWALPVVPTCGDCAIEMKPVVYYDRGWTIGHACPDCRMVHASAPADWPFEENEVVHETDFERLGFCPIDEENLQAGFGF